MNLFIKSLLGICLTSVAFAGPPRDSFTAGEYEAAKAKAQETGKPIAIVTTTIKSNCPKCMKGNEEVFKNLKDDYILVIDDDTTKEKLPDKIKQQTYPIYKSKGNFIPIVAVLSQSDGKLLGGLCYNQIAKDGKKAFTTLEKEVADAMAKAPATAPAGAGDKPAAVKEKLTSGMREWVNSDGKSIQAEALSCNESTVKFKLPDGKVVDYPLDKLSEKSRETALEYAESN